MADDDATEGVPVLLELPTELSLRGVSRSGPLRLRGRWAGAVSPGLVSLPGLDPAQLADLTAMVGPLRADSGLDATAQLVCELLPEPARLRVAVTGPLPPGVYRGEVRIGPGAGRLPVTVEVVAWWPWLFGALLAGVLLLALSGFLAGQATLAARRAEVFDLRETLTRLIEHGDGAALTAARGAAADDALGAALAILAQPRPPALADTRLARADVLIGEAGKLVSEMREAAARAAPGEGAVAELTAAWAAAKARLAGLREQFTAQPGTGSGATPDAPAGDVAALDATLAALEQGLATTLVLPLADALGRELAVQVERVQLVAQSGAGDRAGQLARRTRERLAFLLAALLERADLTLSLRALSQEANGRAWLLREALVDPALPATVTDTLRAQLATASTALIAHPSLAALQQFTIAVRQLESDLLLARADAVVADVERARAQMEQETTIEAIDAALAKLTPGGSQEERQARLTGIIELWRVRIADFTGPRRASMAATLDQLEQKRAAWDVDALAAGFQQLTQDWAAYGNERFATLRDAPVVAFCQRESAAAALALVANQRALDLSPPEPALAGLADELDGLGFRLARLPQDGTCLAELVAIGARYGKVGAVLFESSLLRSNLPPDLRLDAARRAGALETVALMERLMREPRPLLPVPRTPPNQRVEDRELTFDITGLDPAWGSAVLVEVSFGDGTHQQFDAASLYQAGVVTHRYVAPGSYQLGLRAVLAAGAEASAAPLGQGELTVRVDPSPANRAGALSASLLNLRTLLALAFAVLIQGWRLAGRGPFGASGIDYLEAVAIGAGSHAGLDGLGALGALFGARAGG